MEYKLIAASMLATVEDAVNEAMQEGWKPHGSLVRTPSKWVQPMIREDMLMFEAYQSMTAEKELARVDG